MKSDPSAPVAEIEGLDWARGLPKKYEEPEGRQAVERLHEGVLADRVVNNRHLVAASDLDDTLLEMRRASEYAPSSPPVYATRSPGFTSVTPVPISSTTPAPSPPNPLGNGWGYSD